MSKRNTALMASIVAVTLGGTAVARDQIKIVGSSTVFPFSTSVAESYARATGAATPVVEPTGSGSGMNTVLRLVTIFAPEKEDRTRET